MKILNFFIIILIIIIPNSCYKNPIERNQIVFKDKIENVQASILTMKGLLMKLPKRVENLNINYKIKNKKLYVNDQLFDDNFIKVKKLNFTIAEKKDFLALAQYLNKNHLSAAFFDESAKTWRFIYRDIEDITYDDSRSIAVLDSSKAISIHITDTILDQKGHIFLLAPKDAKIR